MGEIRGDDPVTTAHYLAADPHGQLWVVPLLRKQHKRIAEGDLEMLRAMRRLYGEKLGEHYYVPSFLHARDDREISACLERFKRRVQAHIFKVNTAVMKQGRDAR
jgi:hypothetical protein